MAGSRQIKPLSIVLAVVGVLLIVVGIIYLAVKAPDLPGFIPGKVTYKANSKVVHHPKAYTKRGIAALILAALAFAGAWYVTYARRGTSVSQHSYS